MKKRPRKGSARTQRRKTLLRFPQVQQIVGLSRCEIARRVALGEFPAPIKLGLRCVAWDDDAVQQYVISKLAGSASHGCKPMHHLRPP